MAALGLRAFGTKGLGWLRRNPWAPLSAGFCSRGPGPRPTSARQREGIRNIVLSDPKKRNALSLAMLKSLQSDLLHEADSKDLKVVIISAEGPVFSSGHDLKELTDEQSPDYHAEVFQTCSEVMMLIQNHPVPVIAMVNGLATAAGCQLVASCDIAVASDKSSFATPGVNIGLFCSTPAVALGRTVPRKLYLYFNCQSSAGAVVKFRAVTAGSDRDVNSLFQEPLETSQAGAVGSFHRDLVMFFLTVILLNIMPGYCEEKRFHLETIHLCSRTELSDNAAALGFSENQNK
ncbi:enoyl-CoA hydratase domain-containing protein 3, mitochondrial [Puma concolor]|uniref:Enoyl-CoA hydratase domain-containing protein 3, mitochondrial n=1 Tax=Puma concolor TaxID=9696 RepID=A0A6P6IF03_PUMCO|nr:enoyl-CoA hydratase domain-containing protein 3, mitochondrial [Puma concolor]